MLRKESDELPEGPCAVAKLPNYCGGFIEINRSMRAALVQQDFRVQVLHVEVRIFAEARFLHSATILQTISWHHI
jgi:hypothetical protein